MKEVGIFSNCGSYRPKWFSRKRACTQITFLFSLEVPLGEENEIVDEFRELVHEMVSRWSQSCYRKLKRQERIQKRKGGMKHE